ncbi:hypothetical protein CRG98_022226 [Punica granatum]|uniref:Aspartic peptidase DDI1-type domain-containing protein n=1 Tax=Punica granatum TaxID=22663 RepID=A0A2I0JM82_PUNGR|nr:hypothetical protein CRG98_022226 [Punica granatum]
MKFMKDILKKKRQIDEFETIVLTEECSAILQKKLPSKLKDLGASINLMPLSVSEKLGLGEVKPVSATLQFADRSHAYPRGAVEDVLVKVETGVIEDVLVNVDKFIFLIDFVVLDFEEDRDIPIILRRPFLVTGKTLIDV